MPLDWFLALKFLRDARAQSALIVSGVAVGVAVIVFLSALITGLQKDLIARTLGTQAHIVITPAEEQPRPLMHRDAPPDVVVIGRIEATAQRIRGIDNWQRVTGELARMPEVTAFSPMVSGPAFAVRSNASQPVTVMGVDLASFTRIIDIEPRIVRGRMSVNGREALIGVELADDLGLGTDDKLRVQTADGSSELFTVRGIFDAGNKTANTTWMIVSVRNGQTLLDLPGGISRIDVTIDAIFEADAVSARIRDRMDLNVESWMQRNAELLVGLRSQSSSSLLIQVFVVLAVAIGIASVLVVSVVQRQREIGILRAMGVSRSHVLRVFLIQGGLVGLVGSIVGSGLGAGLAELFRRAAKDPGGAPLFPIELTAQLFITATVAATLTGVIAAMLPARRAARLLPADAIRHE